MKKTQFILLAAGIIVLGLLGYFLFKPAPKQESNNSVNQNSNPASTTPVSEQSKPETPKPVELILDYKKNIPLEPKVIQVTEGQEVIIKATADVIDEVHLHGYDKSIDVKPGEQVIIQFTANKTGRFPIELEKLKIDIGVIEVYPK